MCEDCMDESCKCDSCYNYRHYSACPVWTFSNMIAISAVSLSTGSYINSLFHLHIDLIFFGIPIIIMFAILNMLGIKNSAKTLSILVGINIAILIIFAIKTYV